MCLIGRLRMKTVLDWTWLSFLGMKVRWNMGVCRSILDRSSLGETEQLPPVGGTAWISMISVKLIVLARVYTTYRVDMIFMLDYISNNTQLYTAIGFCAIA